MEHSLVRTGAAGWKVGAILAGIGLAGGLAGAVSAQEGVDPRSSLRPGVTDAGNAAWNVRLIASLPRPEPLFNPENPGDGDFSNTDLAFRGNRAIVGNYGGFSIYDISDPRSPRLEVAVLCPGGQGDVSVKGNLLFTSVEQTRGRVDCGTQGIQDSVSTERFRGIRIFDLDAEEARQVAAVQTCRGSHTHTLVSDPRDADNLYVYVSGTSVARSGSELDGCVPVRDANEPNTSYWSIGVVQVPLRDPSAARLIANPRVFADPTTGAIAGLWQGGNHGEGTQTTSVTNQCHDITAYPELGLAAGACSGNGILFDISDPSNPVRLHEVTDPGFAYWHSATFSNDGSTVIFTDEWGGGRGARCRAEDPKTWGANALFDIVDRKLVFRSYYKLPAAQTGTENCVAHNGSLIPVPGRDIKVQAWYQGGMSIFDFSDPSNPFEIAYFDRGPISETELMTGGYWSTYWYNGAIYGAEIIRGFDVFELSPSRFLSENEIEAAKLVRFAELNPQEQPRLVWPASLVVSRALVDQLERGSALPADRIAALRAEIDRAESLAGASRVEVLDGLTAQLTSEAGTSGDPARVGMLIDSLRRVAGTRGQ